MGDVQCQAHAQPLAPKLRQHQPAGSQAPGRGQAVPESHVGDAVDLCQLLQTQAAFRVDVDGLQNIYRLPVVFMFFYTYMDVHKSPNTLQARLFETSNRVEPLKDVRNVLKMTRLGTLEVCLTPVKLILTLHDCTSFGATQACSVHLLFRPRFFTQQHIPSSSPAQGMQLKNWGSAAVPKS
jgi:hypothetical protein